MASPRCCLPAAPKAAAAAAVPEGSWQTAPYGDSPDALFFCGAGLRQFTGIGAYGCGNGPEGGTVYPWSIAYGGEFPIGIPPHWAFSGWGCAASAAAVAASAAAVAASVAAVAAVAASVAAVAASVAAVAASAVAVETDSSAVIDMSYKIPPRPIIVSEATVTVKTVSVPMRRLLAVSPSANSTAAVNGNTASGSSGNEDASDNTGGNPGGNNANAQTSCLNTGVNTAGHGFGGLGFGGNGLNH